MQFAHAMPPPAKMAPARAAPARGSSSGLSGREQVAFAHATGGMGLGGLWEGSPSREQVARYSGRALRGAPGEEEVR